MGVWVNQRRALPARRAVLYVVLTSRANYMIEPDARAAAQYRLGFQAVTFARAP